MGVAVNGYLRWMVAIAVVTVGVVLVLLLQHESKSAIVRVAAMGRLDSLQSVARSWPGLVSKVDTLGIRVDRLEEIVNQKPEPPTRDKSDDRMD